MGLGEEVSRLSWAQNKESGELRDDSQSSPYSQVIRDWYSGLFMELLHPRSNCVTDFWGSGAKMQSAGLA